VAQDGVEKGDADLEFEKRLRELRRVVNERIRAMTG
jgi:hypothetical protein